MEKEKQNLETFFEDLRKIIEEGDREKIKQVDGDCICVNKRFVVSIHTPLVASLRKAWIVDMYSGFFSQLGAPLVKCLMEKNKSMQQKRFDEICLEFQKASAKIA